MYAADDRAAAREAFERLKEAYEGLVRGVDGEEIRRRVGQRIRELEGGVRGLEERAGEEG